MDILDCDCVDDQFLSEIWDLLRWNYYDHLYFICVLCFMCLLVVNVSLWIFVGVVWFCTYWCCRRFTHIWWIWVVRYAIGLLV